MGSIPLPALSIRPPQQPDTMEQFSRAMALKNMLQMQPLQMQQAQQQVQAGSQENQMRQQQIADQQAMTAAMREWDGKDYSSLPGLVMKHGASANAVMSLKNNIIEQQTKLTQLDKDQLANEQTKNDYFAQAVANIRGLPPEQQPQAFEAAKNDAVQRGFLDPQHAQAMQYQGPEQLDLLEKSLIGHKAAIAAASSQAQLPGQQAESAIKQGQQRAMEQTEIIPGISPEAQQMADWLKKNPGKGPSDFLQWKAKQSPMAMVMSNQLAPDALDMAAEFYRKTGQLPAGFSRSPETTAAVIKRAAEQAKAEGGGGDIAANKATYGADKASLAALQRQRDAVLAFENTAGKNLDLFLKTAQKVVDTGSPWINKPLRSLAIGSIGSADLAAYNAARRVAINEIAKVTSNPGLSGQLSDEARKEVETFNPQDATLAQTFAVAKVLKQDMANRHQAYDEQLKEIRGRLGAKSSGQQGIQVTDPRGVVHTFPTQSAADAFKKAAGIQ